MSADPVRTGKYAHACDEWDGMVIDENDVEISCCMCFQPTTEFLAIQDKWNVELDRMRGAKE